MADPTPAIAAHAKPETRDGTETASVENDTIYDTIYRCTVLHTYIYIYMNVDVYSHKVDTKHHKTS